MHDHDKLDLHPHATKSRPSVARLGLSTLELIGCVTAIGAGLWLGAMVVGFDLREAWNLGVRQAGFSSFELEIPESEEDTDGNESLEWSGSTSEKAAGSTDEVGDTEAKQAEIAQALSEPVSTNDEEQLQQELKRLRAAIKRIEQGEAGEEIPSANQVSASTTSRGASVGKRTLNYWNQLNAIMAKEEQMRTVPAGGLTVTNAGPFLNGRGKAYRYAAEAIRGLPTRGVDLAIGNLARDIAAWYVRGGELSDRAAQIMNHGSTAMRQGPMGKRWQTDEKQHQNELQLINGRGNFLREQMTDKYNLAFPNLR